MILSTDNETRMLARAAEEFAKQELAPRREEFDRFPFGPFFSTVLQKAFELDFFHITLPEAIGGMGMNTAALCAALDAISRQDASLGAMILTNTFAQEILLNAGDAEQLEEMTANAKKANELLLACPIFNNPSEIRHVARVVRRGDRHFLTGKLEYLVLGGIADQAVVPAAEDDRSAYAFYRVDLKQPSITIGEPVLSLGLRCCPAVDVEFHAAEAVPVGQPDEGERLYAKAAARLQAAAAAVSLGIMRGAFDEALAYAKARDQGGRKILEWSEVRRMLADMAVHIQIAGMAVTEACRAVDDQEKGWQHKALAAAIHVQEAAVDVTTDGIQVLGGVGYMKDFGQEKRFRDAKHIQACFGLTPLKRLNLLDSITRKEK
jgi:alkylation response protein AidB-like acyl-CoA dehydrogenase